MLAASRLLLTSAVAAVVGLAVCDVAYGRHARSHFGPNVTLSRAEASGSGCVVTVGDSRMAAGIDAPVLSDFMHSRGVELSVAPLAVGALPISGQAMALRRYIRDGRKPAVVVLGASSGTLLYEDAPDPSALFGNRAAELAWSMPSDVRVYYPDFPFGDLDRGVRFLFARSNALSTYASATWIKTQNLQDLLTGNARHEPRNGFGSLTDMHALLVGFREQATAELAAWDGHWRLSPWFELARRLAHESGARLVVLEVPMPSSYRQDVLDSGAGRRYSAWLQGELRKGGDTFVDMSSPPGIGDEDFGDGVHLNVNGARKFSANLGAKLGSLLPVAGP
jgi:hypothetical protein